MKMDPKVTVIVPVYKTEAFLEQAISSVIYQTYENLEILLIDDGSPDRCGDICEQYAKLDPRIQVIHIENHGLSFCRNFALKKASGRCIVIMDSDDYMDREAISTAVKAMQFHNADVIMWGYVREFKDHSKPKAIFDSDVVFEGEKLEGLKRRFFGLFGEELRHPDRLEALSTTWGKLYKKELFDKCGVECVDTDIVGSSEDALWNSRIFQGVDKAVFINKNFNHYRKYNANSITTGYKKDLCEKWDKLDSYFRDYIAELNLPEDYTRALDNRLCINIITLGLNVLKNESLTYHQKTAEIKRILSKENYRKAYRNLELKYFNIHFRLFFFLAKHNIAWALHIMLCIMRSLMK